MAVEIREADRLLNKSNEDKNSHTFQTHQVYLTIEDFNKQAKYGEDACAKLLELLSNLPEMCLIPCSMCSACLSILVLLLYFGGIIWLSIYDIYELKYYDINNNYQSASMILDCNENQCLSNEYVCKFYGFNSCVSNVTNVTNGYTTNKNQITTQPVASLTQFDLSSMIFIKIQFFIAWLMWARLRWIMKDMSILSLKYAILIIFCNVISFMFRHLGWIYYSNECKIMYSPYFSDDFVAAIISFILSFVLWVILVGVCLKRQRIDNYGNTKLVMRFKGVVIDKRQNIVDNWSVAANVAIYLFFVYAAAGSSLWIGIENYEINIEKFINLEHNSEMDNMHYTTWMSLIEWLGTTIVAYFLPKIKWLSIYTIAAIATNLLFVVDLLLFVLKLVKDLVGKIKQKRKKQKKLSVQNQSEIMRFDEI